MGLECEKKHSMDPLPSEDIEDISPWCPVLEQTGATPGSSLQRSWSHPEGGVCARVRGDSMLQLQEGQVLRWTQEAKWVLHRQLVCARALGRIDIAVSVGLWEPLVP